MPAQDSHRCRELRALIHLAVWEGLEVHPGRKWAHDRRTNGQVVLDKLDRPGGGEKGPSAHVLAVRAPVNTLMRTRC